MSGEAMMSDSAKHVYHSIPLETEGPVVMSDRPHCCAGGRRAMTLLLASALLWVVVLDVMLVVYKSHHLISSSEKDHLGPKLAEEVVIIDAPGPPSVDDVKNSSFPNPPPNATDVGPRDRAPGEEGPKRGAQVLGQNPGRAERSSGMTEPGKGVALLPGLQGWLNRIQYRPQLGVRALDHEVRHPPVSPGWNRPQPAGPRPWVGAEGRPGNGLIQRHFVPSAEFGPHTPPQPVHQPLSQAFGGHEIESHVSGGNRLGIGSHGLGSHTVENRGIIENRGIRSRGLETPKMSPAKGKSSPRESPFLVRFFSAIVDAPWNLTSVTDGRRRPPPPPPLPPPPPPPPPPFLPEHFLNMLGRPRLNALLDDDDTDDSEETIFDIDISD